MRYAIVTFGCRVNQADSLVIEDRLRARGATEAPAEHADLVVVNTCSVTAGADQGARQTVRRIVRSNPDVQVVVTGCYATRRPDEVGALPNVTLVVPNSEKDQCDFTTAQRFADGDGACGGSLAPSVAGRTALTLRVQTGCEEQCSYCIIPQTRGASRSRPLAEIIDDLHRAVSAGYKEIAITGVNLGSYGRDLPGRPSLTTLVRALGEWRADVLFRISSLEPMDCSAEIVAIMAASPRMAPHFHLPLQHGSEAILRAMRRPYSVSYYADLVNRIRAGIPYASIGSDIYRWLPWRRGAPLRRDARGARTASADASSRVSVFRSTRHRRGRHAPQCRRVRHPRARPRGPRDWRSDGDNVPGVAGRTHAPRARGRRRDVSGDG